MLSADRILKGYKGKGLIFGRHIISLERDSEISPEAEGFFTNNERKRRQTEDLRYNQTGISHHHKVWRGNSGIREK